MKFLQGLCLSIVSAILLILSFPPINMGYLVWFALVPLIIAQFTIAERNWQAKLFLAITYFLFMDVSILLSFPRIDLGYGDVWYLITGVVAVFSLFVFFSGLPNGSHSFHRNTGYRFFLIYPVMGWVGLEYLRYLLDLGQMWGMLFIPQHNNLPLIQLSTLFGMWIITAIIVFVNYSIGLCILKMKNHGLKSIKINSMILVTVIVLSHLFGFILLNDGREITGSVRVASIQPGENFRSSKYYSPDRAIMTQKLLSEFERLTKKAAEHNVELVVWPEAALWVNPSRNTRIMLRMIKLAADNSIYLSVPYFDHSDPRGVINEVITFSPNGKILGIYAKNHPIEFKGYLDGSATKGMFPVYSTGFGKFSNMIGYDVDFTDVARKLAKKGVQLITVSMHDRPSFWYNQFVHNIYRSVENRIICIRSDWRYASSIIDPYGRVVAGPAQNETQAIVIKDIPVVNSGTIYSKIGDIFAVICLFGMIGFAGFEIGMGLKRPRGNLSRPFQ